MITIWFTKEELELINRILRYIYTFNSKDFSNKDNDSMIDIRCKIIDRLKQ